MLQATIAKMPEQEAIYYMKRCVDAGLWVPEKNIDEIKDNSQEEKADNNEKEPIYSTTDDVD